MTAAPYQEFSGRLHTALDHAEFPAGRARTGALATRYAVTRETARKWLAGMTLPELDRIIRMAVDFRVSFEWLATGRGALELKRVADTKGAYDALDPDLQRLHDWLGELSEAQRRGLLQFIGGEPSV